MAIIKKNRPTRFVIDTSAPEGNALFILATARRLADHFSFEGVDKALEEMKSGNYIHLLGVFDYYFGSVCDLHCTEQQVEELREWKRDQETNGAYL